MSGIHSLILNKVRDELEAALITAIPADDPTRAGVVKIGPLQGDPDPDAARISVELYYNDPDQTITGSGMGSAPEAWDDQVDEIECGAAVTWKRRFTIKARCLLESTGEDLAASHQIAAEVRSRIERALLLMKWNVSTTDEYVSRGVLSESIRGQVVQAGGPPDAYDFHIKIRFEVLTTESAGAS